MDKIKKFKQFFEELEIIDQRDISIETFENELTDRQTWELEKWSSNQRLDKGEIIKLSLYFGLFKDKVRDYDFNLKFGGIGKEKINFRGVINKKAEYDKEGKKLSDNVYFLIKGYIKVSLGNDKGERSVNVKLPDIDSVINFLKGFEENLKINL